MLLIIVVNIIYIIIINVTFVPVFLLLWPIEALAKAAMCAWLLKVMSCVPFITNVGVCRRFKETMLIDDYEQCLQKYGW